MHSIDAELQVDGYSLVVNCKKETKLLHLECSKKPKLLTSKSVCWGYFSFIFLFYICLYLPAYSHLSLFLVSLSPVVLERCYPKEVQELYDVMRRFARVVGPIEHDKFIESHAC